MGHDWIFDVLRDLKTYALANGFLALAQKADEALRIAEIEIRHAGGPGPLGGGAGPPGKMQ